MKPEMGDKGNDRPRGKPIFLLLFSLVVGTSLLFYARAEFVQARRAGDDAAQPAGCLVGLAAFRYHDSCRPQVVPKAALDGPLARGGSGVHGVVVAHIYAMEVNRPSVLRSFPPSPFGVGLGDRHLTDGFFRCTASPSVGGAP